MLTNIANKAAKSPAATNGTGGRCGLCGLTGRGCRPVDLGYWCQQAGLVEDKTRWIHPTPNPMSAAVAADPDVAATAAELERLEDLARAAHEAWLEAVLAASRAGIEHTPRGTMARLVGAGKVSGGERERLAQAVEDRLDDLDEAQARVVRARSAHQRAYQRALAVFVNAERAGT